MSADETRPAARPVLLLANGNLNGRVIRLLADHLHLRRRWPVRLVAATGLKELVTWPEERDRPHCVEPDWVTPDELNALVAAAAAFVVPPFWNPFVRELVSLAHLAGTPVMYLMADVGYGVRKLDVAESSMLPGHICVPDPITRRLMIENGIPAPLIRETGSPYFDEWVNTRLRPVPETRLRIGVLANPDGMRERLTNREERTPEGVIEALQRVLGLFPGAQVTVRLHPRQAPARIDELFSLPASAAFEPLEPSSPLADFLSAHHVIVGSYSAGLMVARLLGRAVVSFQPPMADDGLRREIFATWDVPVATDEDMFAAMVAERLRFPGGPLDLPSLLYEPGRSLEAIEQVIDEALARRGALAGVSANAWH
ncbi:MAG: hypothetical protein AB7F99_00230 [Vicinamibacterales bacterium]